MTTLCAATLAALFLTASPVLADTMTMPMPGMDHSGHAAAGPGADTPEAKALAEVNAKMHADMAVPMTGDADVDFIAGMIPHHQGAVDMAKIVLRYGTDPEVRALAQRIIDSQEAEIAWMKGWLAAHQK